MSKVYLAALPLLGGLLITAPADAAPFDGLHVGLGVGAANQSAREAVPGTTGGLDKARASGRLRGFAGYDARLGDKVVLGAEIGLFNGPKTISQTVQGATAQLRPRMGYDVSVRGGLLATDRLLVFGRAGYANQGFESKVARVDGSGTLSQKSRSGGALLGVGGEYAVSNNLGLRAEYDRLNLSKGRKQDEVMVSAVYRF